MLLLFAPCFAFCGVFGLANIRRVSTNDANFDAGSQVVARLESERARSGAYPESVELPERFKYERHEDGGFALWFPEAGFLLPSDFFYVWNGGTKSWDEVEDYQLEAAIK